MTIKIKILKEDKEFMNVISRISLDLESHIKLFEFIDSNPTKEEINNHFYIEDIVRLGYFIDKIDLDILYEYPKEIVLKQGYFLDKFINDDSITTRLILAKQGYRLDKLINDRSLAVKVAVANQNYGLNILINDKDLYVRNSAIMKFY